MILTPAQSRMARAGLEWSSARLAAEAGIGLNTVNRFEGGHDGRASSAEKIARTLEAAGVRFLADDAGGVGVMLTAI